MKKLLLVLLVATPALAQDTEPEPTTQKVKFKERTELEFDAVDVNATTSGPSMSTVTARTPLDDFNPLIELRKDFSREIGQSVDEVK
jgi:hypothetical protein